MNKNNKNTNNKISIHELYEIKKQKELVNTNVFKYLLDKCYKKIRHIAQHGGMSLYHKIDKIVIGFPLYNYDTCMDYLIKQLQSSGLYVTRLAHPNDEYLYISWKIQDISPKMKDRLLL